MVRAHYRSGFPVRAHVRRKELASENNLREILTYYQIACPDCNNHQLNLNVDRGGRVFLVNCPRCRAIWGFDRKLLEESGPQIADTLLVKRHACYLIETHHVVLAHEAALAIGVVDEHLRHRGLATGNEVRIRRELLKDVALACTAWT